MSLFENMLMGQHESIKNVSDKREKYISKKELKPIITNVQKVAVLQQQVEAQNM